MPSDSRETPPVPDVREWLTSWSERVDDWQATAPRPIRIHDLAPQATAYRCKHATEWIAVKTRCQLTFDPAEQTALPTSWPTA
ncbi:hypothetical protein GCM10022295_62710 [Streptomyces osmaniensis]|uniref:Uncharacterized protein n=1 Tax=Streptomyces osmaniensis TaxID=593134 RepID=A0ABP6XVP9_9ACTN